MFAIFHEYSMCNMYLKSAKVNSYRSGYNAKAFKRIKSYNFLHFKAFKMDNFDFILIFEPSLFCKRSGLISSRSLHFDHICK